MSAFGSKVWACAAVGGLVFAGVAGASFGSAAAGSPVSVAGVAACDPQTGEQVITWTLHNFTNDYIDIQGATLDATALTAGTSLDTTVAMSPASNILSTAESVGTSSASGDATGVLTLNVAAYQANIDSFVNFTGNITLTGACSAAPTTTAAPTTAPVTTLLGSGGGSLPASGNGNTLPVVAALLTAAGLGLLLLRRRPSGTDSITN